MIHALRILLLSLTWVALLGCVQGSKATMMAPPPPMAANEMTEGPALRPAPSIGTELFRFRLKLRGIELAKLSIESKAINRDRTRLIAKIDTSGVAGFFRHVSRRTVTITDQALPVTSWAQRVEQGTWRRNHTRFQKDVVTVVTERESGSTLARRRSQLGGPIFNGETALAALRHWRPKSGDVAVGVGLAETRLWWLRFEASDETEMSYNGEKVSARAIEGVMWRMTQDGRIETERAPRRVTVWLSLDERRLPLRVEADTKFGAVKIELR